jgi:DNA-binding CsgD family transcriptional regulator
MSGSSGNPSIARQWPTTREEAAISAADLLGLYSATTLGVFLDRVHRTLSKSMQCAYVSAFYKRSGEGFLEERDSRGRVWGGRFMRRYAELTPAVRIVSSNPGITLLSTRDALRVPDGELRSSPLYLEIMRRQGWRHGAVLCFWTDPPGTFPFFVLTFYRTEAESDFSDQELACLEQVHAYLAPAVSRFHQVSAHHSIEEGMTVALRHVPAGLVMLDWQLQLVRSNLAGRRSCVEWIRSTEPSRFDGATALQIPSDLLAACRRLRAAAITTLRKKPRALPPRGRATLVSNSELTATVTMVCAASELAEPGFVIEFERTRSRHTRKDPGPLTRLTSSERQVAVAVAKGRSNGETAEQLGKTIHAVKFLLHRAYAKLGISNRVQLSVLINRAAVTEVSATARTTRGKNATR